MSPDAVRRAACELFAHQGYRGTSMKDIARRLDVSAPNLDTHVPSTQDLLVAIMDGAMDRAHAALEVSLV
ncbi:MAG TPA: helix-turn-helix domain-containing protein, partial [Acidimicrobiia bacterium]|nr:helix-turn-helix domain-containing protein [Acidimicrobiia bacterium]